MVDAALKTQIMNQVDKQFDDQTKVLADLVRIPSTRFREAPAQDMMARLFKEDKLSVDRWQIKIDDLKHLPGYSPHSQDYDDAWNVVGAWRPNAPKGRSDLLDRAGSILFQYHDENLRRRIESALAINLRQIRFCNSRKPA